MLKGLTVILPNNAMQKIIAIYLDLEADFINNTIGHKQEIIFELLNYKKSLFYEYVTGKRRGE